MKNEYGGVGEGWVGKRSKGFKIGEIKIIYKIERRRNGEKMGRKDF